MPRIDPSPDGLGRALEATLQDLLPAACTVLAVHPPMDLGPGRSFLIEWVDRAGKTVSAHLSAALVAAYFADEEGAVDHFHEWLAARCE